MELENVLVWGDDFNLHPRRSREHFLVVGATGSGKSTIIKMLLRSALEGDSRRRALIYDPKQEALTHLHGLFPKSPRMNAILGARIKVLNPLDSRCSAWDLAADIDGPVSARQFATILIPDGKATGADSFFVDAVRDLLTGVILAFINCTPKPARWTFRDVILTMLYQPYLAFMMSLDTTRDKKEFPYVARLRESYLAGDPRTAGNIRSTINSKLSVFEPIAAVWEKAMLAERTFSLKAWAEEGSNDILVLGNDESARAAIDAVNQAIFKRATELVLARPELTEAEREDGAECTWFFLDEVREAGKLDGLSRLMTKGRSKGACVVLGFQDIDGLRDVYGKEVANEICGQCEHTAVLKVTSPSTAQWAVEVFGQRVATSTSRNMQHGENSSITHGLAEDVRPFLQTSDFIYLALPGKKTPLSGFFRKPLAVWEMSHPGWTPDAGFLVELDKVEDIDPYSPAVSGFRGFLPSDPKDHYLAPWSSADWEKFGFSQPVPSWRKPPEPEKSGKPFKSPFSGLGKKGGKFGLIGEEDHA